MHKCVHESQHPRVCAASCRLFKLRDRYMLCAIWLPPMLCAPAYRVPPLGNVPSAVRPAYSPAHPTLHSVPPIRLLPCPQTLPQELALGLASGRPSVLVDEVHVNLLRALAAAESAKDRKRRRLDLGLLDAVRRLPCAAVCLLLWLLLALGCCPHVIVSCLLPCFATADDVAGVHLGVA